MVTGRPAVGVSTRHGAHPSFLALSLDTGLPPTALLPLPPAAQVPRKAPEERASSPVPITEALELGAQQAQQRGAQAAARHQVLHHKGREQVDVEGGPVQPARQQPPPHSVMMVTGTGARRVPASGPA